MNKPSKTELIIYSVKTSQLESVIADFKLNGKGDLAISHLVKEAVALTKWKATHFTT